MPAWPEQLYVLSQRDLQVTWLDPIIRELSASIASPNVNTPILTVPQDRYLILLHCLLHVRPGAGQANSETRINANPPIQGAAIQLLAIGTRANDVREFAHAWPGLLLPPNWSLQGSGNFSAGVAANLVAVSIFGILVPAGNIQRG